MTQSLVEEIERLKALEVSLRADSAAGWDACEVRRLQAEEYRARAQLAETLLLRTGINDALMQEYAARFPIPVPQTLPELTQK